MLISDFRLFNRAVTDRDPRSKNLIATEVVLPITWSGLPYHEIEIYYNIRRSESRGLAPAKLPTVVLGALRSMVDLKSEIGLSANERGG